MKDEKKKKMYLSGQAPGFILMFVFMMIALLAGTVFYTAGLLLGQMVLDLC